MKKDQFEEHYAYMQSVIPALLEAEDTIKAIKTTPQFKRAYNYFHVLYARGELKEHPSAKNRYRIERRDRQDIVSLSDIESILTPEQIDAIRKMKGEKP